MIRLQLVSEKSGESFALSEFPAVLGRGDDAGLVFKEDGVWDRHAIVHKGNEGFELEALGGALVRVNNQPVQNAVLRNGDVIDLGSVKLEFQLAPLTQKSQRLRECFFWGILVSICLVEVVLVYLLGV
ncbi:MAG: FHA domain-containing protein [Verrucomicrobia bacterium]|nr:FHA domain-containing protein [Verrucomicrobiota bacterium]